MPIKKIVNIIANDRQNIFLQHFVSDNYARLCGAGISTYAPDLAFYMDAARPRPMGVIDHRYYIRPDYYTGRFNWLAEQKNGATAETLCLFWPWLGYYPRALQKVYKKLADIFPEAEMTVLWAASRTDRDIENALIYSYLVSVRKYLPLSYRDAERYFTPLLFGGESLDETPDPLHSLQWLLELQKQKKTHCHFYADAQRSNSGSGLLDMFAQCLEVDSAQFDFMDSNVAVTDTYFTIQPELAAFINSIRGMYFTLYEYCKHDLPEKLFAHYVTSDAGIQFWSKNLYQVIKNDADIPKYSFLGKDTRQKIICKYAKFMQNFSNVAGADLEEYQYTAKELLPAFTYLTKHDCVLSADKLSNEFACTLYADIDELPDKYLLSDMIMCKKSLRHKIYQGRITESQNHRITESQNHRITESQNYHEEQDEYKCSVITLTYNHCAYIKDNIESVLAQKTTFPVKHIIVDHASNDGTAEIIDSYAEKFPTIEVVHVLSRLEGAHVFEPFTRARSPFVALCDGDDYFTDPCKLQKQVDFLEAHPDSALCFHKVRLTYEDNPEIEEYYPKERDLRHGVKQFYYLADLLRLNLIQSSSVMYRWRFQDALPDWFELHLTTDDLYWHILHAEQGKAGYIDESMSVYRRHKGALFYATHLDIVTHRAQHGLNELICYDIINRHLGGRYFSILLPKSYGVFMDLARDAKRRKDFALIERAALACPDLARLALIPAAEHENMDLGYIISMLPEA